MIMKNRQKYRQILLLASLLAYPLTFFVMSPDLLFFGASDRIVAGDVIFFGILFLTAFLGGRLYCGWICPAGACQEFTFKINNKPLNNKWNWIKFIPFIPWFAFFIIIIFLVSGFKEIDFFYKKAFGVSLIGLGEWIMYFGTVAIVVIPSIIKGKRWLCHYLCWVSPFMIVGGIIRDFFRIPSIRLRTIPTECNNCGLCSKVCTMSLPVMEMVKQGGINHNECILCSTCVDSCKKSAIRFTFSSKQRNLISTAL